MGRLSDNKPARARRLVAGLCAGALLAVCCAALPLLTLLIPWRSPAGPPMLVILATVLAFGTVAAGLAALAHAPHSTRIAVCAAGLLLLTVSLSHSHVALTLRGEPTRVQISGSQWRSHVHNPGGTCEYVLKDADGTELDRRLSMDSDRSDCPDSSRQPGSWLTVHADPADRIDPLPGSPRLFWPLTLGLVLAAVLTVAAGLTARGDPSH